MFTFNKISPKSKDFVNSCFSVITGNEGLPLNPQFSIDELIYNFDYNDPKVLDKIVHAYLEMAGFTNSCVHSDFEIIVVEFDLENYPFATFPNLFEVNLVSLGFVDDKLQKVTISYNRQLHQIILCELAILLSNTQKTFPSFNAINETMYDIRHQQIVYSIFHGFGLLLLLFNETSIKIYAREHYFNIPIHYHLNNDEIKYSIALWQTMYHFEYNLQQAMQNYFPKKYFNTIHKMIDEISSSDIFHCERILKKSLYYEAFECYWDGDFEQALAHLNNPAIYTGVDEYRKADIYELMAQCYMATNKLSQAKEYFNKSNDILPESSVISNMYIMFINLVEQNSYSIELFEEYCVAVEQNHDFEYGLTVENFLLKLVESMIKRSGDNLQTPLSFDENNLNVTDAVLYKHYLLFWSHN